MNEIKFMGRGGQGTVIASQMLGLAFFKAGLYPQCFSVFGGERRGAPVMSFLRVDEEKILLKCGIRNPNELIYLDDSLIDTADIRSSLRTGGRICINTDQTYESLNPLHSYTLALIDARKIAKNLGLGRIMNTAILGGYWKMVDHHPLKSLLSAVEDTIPAKKQENLAAVLQAYESVTIYEPSQE